jgi:hypothetical protein
MNATTHYCWIAFYLYTLRCSLYWLSRYHPHAISKEDGANHLQRIILTQKSKQSLRIPRLFSSKTNQSVLQYMLVYFLHKVLQHLTLHRICCRAQYGQQLLLQVLCKHTVGCMTQIFVNLARNFHLVRGKNPITF